MVYVYVSSVSQQTSVVVILFHGERNMESSVKREVIIMRVIYGVSVYLQAGEWIIHR